MNMLTNDKENLKKTILLVDDENYIVEMIAVTLEIKGYKVLSTDKALEALELFKNHQDEIGLIISDQKMPRMLGTELAENILQIRNDVPIVIYTGFADEIDNNRAEELRLRIIKKPIIRNLLKEVADILGI